MKTLIGVDINKPCHQEKTSGSTPQTRSPWYSKILENTIDKAKKTKMKTAFSLAKTYIKNTLIGVAMAATVHMSFFGCAIDSPTYPNNENLRFDDTTRMLGFGDKDTVGIRGNRYEITLRYILPAKNDTVRVANFFVQGLQYPFWKWEVYLKEGERDTLYNPVEFSKGQSGNNDPRSREAVMAIEIMGVWPEGKASYAGDSTVARCFRNW